MFSSYKNIVHLLGICREFARNDALFFITPEFPKPIYFASRVLGVFTIKKNSGLTYGERLLKTFQNLGPTFIKLGQFLSIRPDLVGNEISNTLAKLQDRLEPFSFEETERTFLEQFGKSTSEIFQSFEKVPVAAASISQVHFAVDHDGHQVAVKVLRPGIEQKFAKDLSALLFLAELVEDRLAIMKRLKLVESVYVFKRTSETEMDMQFEAAAADEFRENLRNDQGVYVPKVYWRLTAQKILTLERISGFRVDDVPTLVANGIEPNAVLKISADLFLNQALRDGFFHADMHPGNVYINPKGELVIFDFGIMGRLDYKTRIFLAELLLGFLNKDYKKVADIHFDAGYIPAHQNRELFEQACRAIGEPIFGLSQKDISIAQLLKRMLRVAEKFEMEVQPQLILLQKTMMMAEGIGRQLNPNINFWELSQDLIEKWAIENFGPKARARRFHKESKEFLLKVKNLIENAEKVITPAGLLIHPTIIDEVNDKRRSNKNNFWKGLTIGIIITLLIIKIYLLNQ